MAKEIVDLKTIAQRLGYDFRYMQNKWHVLLQGARLLKLNKSRMIRFYWEDIEKLLESRK